MTVFKSPWRIEFWLKECATFHLFPVSEGLMTIQFMQVLTTCQHLHHYHTVYTVSTSRLSINTCWDKELSVQFYL